MSEKQYSDVVKIDQKKLPHGVDVYKEDLDGEYWWLQDNDYLYRGYRTKLSFTEAFKSLFRSTNETMNIWTHLLGALLFIFLIYLTYAIPVEDIFTLRQDVARANAIVQCSYKNYSDILQDETTYNATCYEALSQDESVAEQFSTLFYYMSKTSLSSETEHVHAHSNSYFSWFNDIKNNNLTKDTLQTIQQSVQSLYHKLINYLPFSTDSEEKKNIEKSVAVTEVLQSNLQQLNHQVVGHVPRWPIIVFIICAIWCMGGSAIYHQYYCTSFLASNILQTIDYCGICILISGSYVPVIYYSFYCYPTAMMIHLSIVIIINILNLCVMATPKFRSPAYRSVRAKSFTIVACYAVIALIHLYILDGFNNPMFTVMFWYVVGMGGTYILGAVLYGTRFPEKFWPGHFDYVFSSHQLFHVCIVIAALFHYVGSYQIFISRLNTPCPMS